MYRFIFLSLIAVFLALPVEAQIIFGGGGGGSATIDETDEIRAVVFNGVAVDAAVELVAFDNEKPIAFTTTVATELQNIQVDIVNGLPNFSPVPITHTIPVGVQGWYYKDFSGIITVAYNTVETSNLTTQVHPELSGTNINFNNADITQLTVAGGSGFFTIGSPVAGMQIGQKYYLQLACTRAFGCSFNFNDSGFTTDDGESIDFSQVGGVTNFMEFVAVASNRLKLVGSIPGHLLDNAELITNDSGSAPWNNTKIYYLQNQTGVTGTLGASGLTVLEIGEEVTVVLFNDHSSDWVVTFDPEYTDAQTQPLVATIPPAAEYQFTFRKELHNISGVSTQRLRLVSPGYEASAATSRETDYADAVSIADAASVSIDGSAGRNFSFITSLAAVNFTSPTNLDEGEVYHLTLGCAFAAGCDITFANTYVQGERGVEMPILRMQFGQQTIYRFSSPNGLQLTAYDPGEAKPLIAPVQASTATLSIGTFQPADSSGGSFSLTVPAGAIPGEKIIVSDSFFSAGTNNITIDFTTNSQSLFGTVQDYILNVNGGQVEFTYMDATIGWVSGT